MIRFLKIFLLLSSVFFLPSCSGPKECIPIKDESSFSVKPVVHLIDNTPVLYRANFEVLKYEFSGLIAFRKLNDDDEIRIAMLSEVGLKLMEFSYANHQIQNTYCSPAITKKSIPRFVGSFLQLLVKQPDCKSTCFFTEGNKSNYFCRTRSERVLIETSASSRTIMEFKNSGRKGVKSTYISSVEIPDEITVKMKYRTTIILKKVKNAFK